MPEQTTEPAKAETKVEQLKRIIIERTQEIQQLDAEATVIKLESQHDIQPLARERAKLETQIETLRDVSDSDLTEMGFTSRKNADERRRELEDRLAHVRADQGEKTRYWQEKANIVVERAQKASSEREKAQDRLELFG